MHVLQVGPALWLVRLLQVPHVMTKSGAEKLLDLERYGFWTRTKQPPYRRVRWEPQTHEDGRQSFRGQNWVEVLAYGEDRDPMRFHTADVETENPSVWLTYYPAVTEPICGWGRPHLPDGAVKYCPRPRDADNPFCPTHMAELNEERNLSGEDQSGACGE